MRWERKRTYARPAERVDARSTMTPRMLWRSLRRPAARERPGERGDEHPLTAHVLTDDVLGSVRRVHDAVVEEVERNWSLMGDEKPRMLRSWIDGDHLLFVYQPRPETDPDRVLGLDHWFEEHGPSPAGLSNPSDYDRALDIARYQILEPSGPAHVVPGTISWTPPAAGSVSRPATVAELRAMPPGKPGTAP